MKWLKVAGVALATLAIGWLGLAAVAGQAARVTAAASETWVGDEWREKAAVKMDEALLAALRAGGDELLTVIVRLGGQADLSGAAALSGRVARGAYVYDALRRHAAASQAGLRAYLDAGQRAGRVAGYRPYFIFNGLAVTARPETIWQIALRREVQAVTADHQYELLDDGPAVGAGAAGAAQTPGWNIALIQADQVWSVYGVTGEGVLVANIDTGVQHTHPALVGQYAGNLGGGLFDHDFAWFDATAAVAAPYDDNGHGTHTMGTAVGGDGPGPLADDIGVAPGAQWIAVKAFSAGGTGAASDIHAAFEWLLAPCRVGVQPGDPACDPARAPTSSTTPGATTTARPPSSWPTCRRCGRPRFLAVSPAS